MAHPTKSKSSKKHHCPGDKVEIRDKYPSGDDTMIPAGKCRYNEKPRYCKKHQWLCEVHTTKFQLRSERCKSYWRGEQAVLDRLADEAAAARQKNLEAEAEAAANKKVRTK